MVVKEFSPYGGLELYTYQLIKGLLAAGLKITVLCEENKADFTHSNLSIHLLPKPNKYLSKWQMLKHQWQIASNVLAQIGPFDLIHSQHFPVKGAHVVTFHNHTVERISKAGYLWEQIINSLKSKLIPAYKLRYFIDESLCEQAKCIIFPAKVMHEDYYSCYSFLKSENKPYVVAYPGISKIVNTKSEQTNKDSFNFLFVGRGKQKKGLDTLFAALKKLKQKNPSHLFHLYIAGLSQKFFDLLCLKLQDISNNVSYLGFQKDMEQIYKKTNAIVVPAKLEPFGMAITEAMQYGLIPIISRVSGVSELLENKKDALILENHLDADELASLMLELTVNNKLVSIMSSNSRAKANSINWENTVKQTLNAYQIALESKLTQEISRD
jgi:glycosyltransferase involved in cell wall biosynthesis